MSQMAENIVNDYELMTLDAEFKKEMGIHCDLEMRVQDPRTIGIIDSSQQFMAGLDVLPAVGSLPGGRRSAAAVMLAAATAGTAPEAPGCSGSTTHHQSFPPSPPFASAVPVESTGSPVMQQASMDARPNFLDDTSMVWLTQNLRYPTHEPLDLRPHLESEMDSWVRREYNDLLANQNPLEQINNQHHHPNPHQHQQNNRLSSCNFGDSVPNSSSASFSASEDCDSLAEMPSPTFNQNGKTIKLESVLNDDQLTKLSVRDLNRHLHGYPSEVVKRLKQKRRTLKNRGYAQNCRTKRIAIKHQLERSNRMLKAEIERLSQENEVLIQSRERVLQERDRALQERDFYKQQAIIRSRDCPQENGSLTNTNGTGPSSPDFYI